MTDRIIGIDTASWQSEAPWRAIAESGVQFAWIKGVHGLSTQPDPQFVRSWRESRGLLTYGRGAYQWLTDSDPVKQGERIVRLLEGTGDVGELYPTVDWEEPTTQFRGEALVLHALKALRRVRELSGGAVLYTGAWYVAQYVAADKDIDRVVSRELLDEICSYPLFHAEYPRIELRDRRACGLAPPTIPEPRLGKIWRDRGIPHAVQQFDGTGGCELPNGVDADFDVATAAGMIRVRRPGAPIVTTIPAPSSAPDTLPQTPTSKSSGNWRFDLSSAATPLRAGEGEHTVKTEDVDL
jgi:hypothetical protein